MYEGGNEMNSITRETRMNSFMSIARDAARRRDVILQILRAHGNMTAQEVATVLHMRGITPSGDRNFAAPRLTELKQEGKVKTVGKKRCTKTGRSVTVWQVAGSQKP
jgi:predicted ArsR family transcriptional regulator